MHKAIVRVLSVALTLLPLYSWTQSSTGTTPESSQGSEKAPALHLTPLEVIVSSEIASAFLGPFVCDSDGNLYLRSESAGVTAIRKLNAKGERVALYEPSTNPDVKVGGTGYFSVTPDGELYALAFATNELTRYVLVFKSDGTYKTKIKLDPGFYWIPSALAVFPNGNLLVTGQEYDRDPKKPKLPFTGVFRADGKLLKELNLEDDNAIQDMAAAQDSRVVSPTVPTSNRAVSWSQIEAAKDGNLYLMRWLSPAIIYAISPGGHVVRRFTVDPGNADLKPDSMHISGNREGYCSINPRAWKRS